MKILAFTLFSVAITCAAILPTQQPHGSKSVLAFRTPTAPEDDLVPITNADSVIAILAEDYGLRANGGPKLISAIWPDGQMIWSENPVLGGEPYFSGTITPGEFVRVFKRIESDGYFSIESLKHDRVGPDSKFTSIVLKNKESKLRMTSWHEVFESNGKTVCTSGGVRPLRGKRLEPLANDKLEYVHYRLAWAELRLMISQLTPSDSKTIKGEIHSESGVYSWNPTQSK